MFLVLFGQSIFWLTNWGHWYFMLLKYVCMLWSLCCWFWCCCLFYQWYLCFSHHGFMFLSTFSYSFMSSAQNNSFLYFLWVCVLGYKFWGWIFIMESVTFYLTMVNSIIRDISLDYPCGLLALRRHCSRLSWLSMFPLRIQLVFWWVFLYLWLKTFFSYSLNIFCCILYLVSYLWYAMGWLFLVYLVLYLFLEFVWAFPFLSLRKCSSLILLMTWVMPLI